MSGFKSALVNVTLSQQPTLRAPLVHTCARYSFPYLYLKIVKRILNISPMTMLE